MNNKLCKCGLLNVQSLSNKTIEIRELIFEFGFDIFILTETWLTNDTRDASKLTELLPDTHTFHHVPRKDKIGGGVGILISKKFNNVRLIEKHLYPSFEHMEINFDINNKTFKVVVIYRPPENNINYFIEDFRALLESLNEKLRNTYLCSDFNIWMDRPSLPKVKNFCDLLETYNIINKVTQPTSRSDHVIDLVLSDKDFGKINRVVVDPDCDLSFYHRMVSFDIDLDCEVAVTTSCMKRNKENLDSFELINACVTKMDNNENHCRCQNYELNSENCVNCYTNMFRHIFSHQYDIMCPLTIKKKN